MAEVKKVGSPQVARPVAAPVAKKAAAVAPAPAQPKVWGAKTADAAQAQARVTTTSFGAQPKTNPATLRQARAELANAQLSAPLGLSTIDDRRALVASSSQNNPLAVLANNSGVICSAASTVNALLLNSGTDATRMANATALERSADALGVWSKLPPNVMEKDVRAALENFKNGSMKPVDVWNLQQLAWAQVQVIEPSSLSTGGAKPGVLGALVSQLAQHGAEFGGARFTESVRPGGAHWTVVAGDTFADSSGKGTAREATSKDGPGVTGWAADVRAPVGKTAVRVQTLDEGDQVASFTFLPMMVSTTSPAGLARMRLNADGQVQYGDANPVPREK